MDKASATRLHAHRAARRDRDHRRPDRAAAARGAGGPRGGPPRPVHQQPQADRPGAAQLRQRHTSHSPWALRSPGPICTVRLGYQDWGCWSAQALLLGYLEQTPAYNAANFNLGTWLDPGWQENTTTNIMATNSFICPSDGISPQIPPDGLRWSGWNNNYFQSAGSSVFPGIQSNASLADTNGLFSHKPKSTKFASVTDGTSNTIAFGESLVGSNDARVRFRTGVYPRTRRTPPSGLLDASTNPAAIMQDLETCMTAFQAATRHQRLQQGVPLGDRWSRRVAVQHDRPADPRASIRSMPVRSRLPAAPTAGSFRTPTATTPAGPISRSATAACTSSSRRSPCRPTGHWGAGPEARSSRPIATSGAGIRRAIG